MLPSGATGPRLFSADVRCSLKSGGARLVVFVTVQWLCECDGLMIVISFRKVSSSASHIRSYAMAFSIFGQAGGLHVRCPAGSRRRWR